jgi:lysophospholipid acyltransferase (LPLAT)-like uncharacterized protein
MTVRTLLGHVLGHVARLWLATLRVRLEVHPQLAQTAAAPWVLAFFHGTQWPLLAWRRRRPTLVMVSHSDDGTMQARALGLLGFEIVRGSSSRGGARGLAAVVRKLRRGGFDAAFAVDGPRGPYGDVKPGAALAARRAGGVVVPMGSAMSRGRVFDRAWDRFALAWPFTRVAVVLGAPVAGDDPEGLARAIAEANARAAALLGNLAKKGNDTRALERALAGPPSGIAAELNGAGGDAVQYRGSPRLNWLEEEKVDHA